jgi:hypothetical protein
MIDLTPEAKRRLESYMTQIRATLRGNATVDDVEQSVREHVEIALAGVPGPISAERLDPVLAQLGSPERWVSEDELPALRRVMMRLSGGPEDWRLAYGSFALTLLMFVTFPIGGFLLLIPAFILSRAFVDHLAGRGEPIGARRWLVYPPIVILLLLVTISVMVLPVMAAGAIGIGNGEIDYLLRESRDSMSRLDRIRVEIGFLSSAAGIWWIVLAGVFALAYRPYRATFLPLTASLKRTHAFVPMLVGAIFLGLGMLLLFVV